MKNSIETQRVFIKYEGNPVMTAADMPADIMYVLNPGAIKHNGEYIMIMDAATLSTPLTESTSMMAQWESMKRGLL